MHRVPTDIPNNLAVEDDHQRAAVVPQKAIVVEAFAHIASIAKTPPVGPTTGLTIDRHALQRWQVIGLNGTQAHRHAVECRVAAQDVASRRSHSRQTRAHDYI
ncbi:MAG: hypothetical protein NVSMB2_10930 [Chloroflexota bacterium]